MKGPYERLKYDFRRGWECPVCKRKEKTDFTVTFRLCQCTAKKEGGQPATMTLVEDGVRRVWEAPPRAAIPAGSYITEAAVVETVPESAASVPETLAPPPEQPATEDPPVTEPLS